MFHSELDAASTNLQLSPVNIFLTELGMTWRLCPLGNLAVWLARDLLVLLVGELPVSIIIESRQKGQWPSSNERTPV